jgi:two-component system, cell cycle response regulator DivK
MEDSKSKLVLIVDDFKDTREMYTQYLTQHGVSVAAAGDGAAAFSQAVQLQPDLILMDLSLPDMSGSEVVSKLKANTSTVHIPVLALTAYGPEHMAGAVAEAGFSGYLAKTTPLDQLLLEVLQALGNPKPNGLSRTGTVQQGPQSSAPPQSRTSPDGHVSGAQGRKLVLIADDFADDLEMYTHFLTERGFRVETAADGQEAVDKATELIPDVVVMDLSLPVISGWEATAKLKTDPRTKHIPVVILTAHAQDGVTTVIKSGCQGFLIKPCLPSALQKEIVRVLSRGSREGGPSSALRATTS